MVGIALVTGAAQGIGAAVVRALAREGTAVAAVDVNADGVTRLADSLVAQGHLCRPYQVDVRDTGQVDAVVAEVEAGFGPIRTLVNVAGVLRTGGLTKLTDEDWDEVFDVNTTGVMRLCRAVSGPMMDRRAGCIITVGSNAGGVARMMMAAYAASKAATAHFTRCLGLELAGHDIRCNVVSPGSTDTAMQRAMWTDGVGEASVIEGSPTLFKVGIPLGRLACPEDVADAVAFLASDRARHITMQELYVDGGASLRS